MFFPVGECGELSIKKPKSSMKQYQSITIAISIYYYYECREPNAEEKRCLKKPSMQMKAACSVNNLVDEALSW